MSDEIVVPSTTPEDTFYPTPKPAESTPAAVTPSSGTSVVKPAGTVQTEAAPEPADTELEPADGKGKSPRQSFAELRTSRDRAEARAELLEKQLAERNKAESLSTKPAAAVVPVVDPAAPKSEDFPTYEEFIDARYKYLRAAESKTEADKVTESKTAETKAAQETKSAKHLEGWNAREKVIEAQYETYNATFSTFLAVAQKNPSLASAVFESEIGPDLAQHLGANPEELTRINGLAPNFMLRAIGVLEDKLQATAGSEKHVTKAPRPSAAIGGTARGSSQGLSAEEVFYGKN